MKISAAGVHNQSQFSRFLRDGKDDDITPITKPEGENASQAGDVRCEDRWSRRTPKSKNTLGALAEAKRTATFSVGKTAQLIK